MTAENIVVKTIVSIGFKQSFRSVRWISDNFTLNNNRSGFSALPDGTRHDSGMFKHIGEIGSW